jgi:putative membrane protein
MTQYLSSLPLSKPSFWLTVVWVLGMIVVPIARWIATDSIIPTTAALTSLLQFAAVFAILVHSWGWSRTVMIFALVAVLTWLAEAIGSKTGVPFGRYSYTDILQPQLFGVPLLIPLAWFMMLGPSWAVAQAILGDKSKNKHNPIVFALVSAFAITAWDLFLDPQMVGWGFWVWHEPITDSLPMSYFGIPWVNYLGWLLTAFFVTLIARPSQLPTMLLVIIYGIVWALQSIGLAVFWGQPGPAAFGFVGMGVLLAWAIKSTLERVNCQ